MSVASVSQARAYEEEANRRIRLAAERVRAAEQESEQALNHIHDAYERQSISQSVKQDEALQNQNNQGYEQIRDIQRQQQKDQQKVKMASESDLQRLKDYYRDARITEERQGRLNLRELQGQNQEEIQTEIDQGREQLEELKDRNRTQSDQIRGYGEKQNSKLMEDQAKQYEKVKAENEMSQARVQKRFEDRFQNLQKTFDHDLDQVYRRGNRELETIRRDTAEKLTAYRERQDDPFYKLVRLNAKLDETSDSFVLTLKIPDYEQAHLSFSVQGDALSVKGYRRNEEKLDIDPGHTQGTASFQSFYETFPLSWPVDARNMSREVLGDQVIVRVPKKNEFAFKKPEVELPEKLRASPPRFPAYLPSSGWATRHHDFQEEKDQNSVQTDGDEASGLSSVSTRPLG